MAVQEKINLSLDVSPGLYQTLESLAQKINGDKGDKAVADVLRKAIASIELAVKAEDEGKTLYIGEKEENARSRI